MMRQVDMFFPSTFFPSEDSPSVTESSTVTSVSHNNSVEDDGGWLGFKAEIAGIARCLKQSIPPAIDNLADTIHKSAMTIAAEFSELEEKETQMALQQREQAYQIDDHHHTHWSTTGEGFSDFGDDSELTVDNTAEVPFSTNVSEQLYEYDENNITLLPWIIHVDDPKENNFKNDTKIWKEDFVLKEKILALSQKDCNFLKPYDTTDEEDNCFSSHFILDDAHIDLIRRLLIIDEKLTKVHARLRAHNGVKETTFWRNYFYHCYKMRNQHIQDCENGCQRLQSQNMLSSCSKQDLLEECDDGELVEAPPISCTGYYTRFSSQNNNPSQMHHPRTLSSDSLVLVGTDEDELRAAIKT
jgi:hypothetical protein